MYLPLLLIIAASSIKLPNHHQVIVIGAGVSGLAASKQLTKTGVQHIILQSRQRIGGRIKNVRFDGVNVYTGAQYLHAKSRGDLKQILKDMDLKADDTDESEHYVYQREGKLDQSVTDKAIDSHLRYFQRAMHAAYQSQYDMSVEDAGWHYYDTKIDKKTQKVRDTVNWLRQTSANNEGADLGTLSARQNNGKDDTSEYRPQGGYQTFIDQLNRASNGKIFFGERVLKIDYRGKFIKVTTQQGNNYYARKVICSIPLGVLQANVVKFVPPLPSNFTHSMMKIGFGNMNKLFVSFSQKVWGDMTGWIYFITKGRQNKRYPMAKVVTDKHKNILCFFLAGIGGKQVTAFSHSQLKKDLAKTMKHFFPQQKISIRKVMLSRWDIDPNSMGSYSYYKVGTTQQDILNLRHPIGNKLWFVGEHTHPLYSSMVHGAYQTGQWAAKQVQKSLGLKNFKHWQYTYDDEDEDEDEDAQAGQEDRKDSQESASKERVDSEDEDQNQDKQKQRKRDSEKSNKAGEEKKESEEDEQQESQ